MEVACASETHGGGAVQVVAAAGGKVQWCLRIVINKFAGCMAATADDDATVILSSWSVSPELPHDHGVFFRNFRMP